MNHFSRARIVRNKTKSKTRQHGTIDNGTKSLCCDYFFSMQNVREVQDESARFQIKIPRPESSFTKHNRGQREEISKHGNEP